MAQEKHAVRTRPEPCAACDANQNAGWIPAERPFPSGHQRNPFHPNCVCYTAERQAVNGRL